MNTSPDPAAPHDDDGVQRIASHPEPFGPTAELQPDPLDELSFLLLGAVYNRDEDTARRLLDDGASLNARNYEGKTPLHLAVCNGHKSMVQILLQRGPDLEATASNGNKPLFDAAESGYIDIVELLLDFNADVEAFNIDKQRTAFYQAVENGHSTVAKTLLRYGADIDVRSPAGLTPLFCAVHRGDLEFVRYLLKHGANKKLTLDDGRAAEDFANGNAAIIELLRTSQVIQGPSITNPDSTIIERRFTPKPFLPANQVNKQNACHGFEATIIDFFVGDREQRIQVSASIYDVLYGKGAEAIMDSEKGSMLSEQQRRFRWYHLPANNMEWVEALMSRIFAEQYSGSMPLDDELKSKLGLTSTLGRQYRTLTAQSSFMRPMCQRFPTSEADQLVLFMPYLHFETLRGYEAMSHHISVARAPQGPPSEFAIVRKKKHRRKPAGPAPYVFVRAKKKVESDDTSSTTSNESDEIKISGWKNFFHRGGRLRSALRGRKARASSQSTTLPKVLGIFSTAEKAVKKDDLEQGKGRDSVPPLERLPTSTHDRQNTANDDSRGISLVDAEKEKPMHPLNTETKDESKSVHEHPTEDHKIEDSAPLTISPVIENETQEPIATSSKTQDKEAPVDVSPVAVDADLSTTTGLKDGQLERNQGTAEISRQVSDENQNLTSPPRADTFKGKDKLADIPEGRPAATEDLGEMAAEPQGQPRRSDPRRPPITRVPVGHLDEVLIKAYTMPSDVGQLAPLQLRRTLDQYFYTHLASTYERDTDQVVLRYTQEGAGVEPKIFMVDQLWLWVLNGDTVISCFPQRWDTSSERFHARPPPPPPPDPKEADLYMRRPVPSNALADPFEPLGQAPPPPRPPPPHQTHPFDPREWGPPPPPPPHPPAPQRSLSHENMFKPAELGTDSKNTAAPPLPSGQLHDGTNVIVNLEGAKSKGKVTVKPDGPGLLGWLAAGKKRKGRRDSIDLPGFIPPEEAKHSRPTSSSEQAEKRRRQAFLQLDPLNVHQTILKHLQGTARAPITSAYEMAKLITSSCTDVFDQYRVPPEYQFFDFFERSIGNLIDQETKCFKLFMTSLETSHTSIPFLRRPAGTNPVLSIAAETKLLVEIKDIRDELGILELVLRDELKAIKEFEQAISGKSNSPPLTQNKVLQSHLERIQKMNELAANTYEALNDLLDLKQKEFNVSEARKQAEITARHVEIANQSQKQGQRQVTLAEATMAQAEETARQGKTVMLFTVVTIIFLPLSFMAAFFAINVDSFPFNENGKLPIRYVLKYMLTISAAISIPFVLVAFNQDRIAKWLKALGKGGIWWIGIAVLAAVLLSIIWTSHLASVIKVAVTVTVVLLALLAIIGQGIYAIVRAARDERSSISSGTGGSLSS